MYFYTAVVPATQAEAGRLLESKVTGIETSSGTARSCVSTTKIRYMTKIECSKGPKYQIMP